jgi:ribonuclease HI
MIVTIYTDGGADPNPGVGGWAAILRARGKEKVLTGSVPHTTNNRMELQAAIAALEALNRRSQVEFHTDSEYLRQGITKWITQWEASGWTRKGKPVANEDLWKKLQNLVQEHDIEWKWVRGHGTDPLNRRADALARQARQSIAWVAELPEGTGRLFVKGTSRGNPGQGTWAVVIEIDGETQQFSGAVENTTNNRMELTAAVEGLHCIESSRSVQVVTESDYLFQGATRWIHGWRQREWRKKDGKPISNKDLWLELHKLMEEREISWQSAKGVKDSAPAGLIEVRKLAQEAKQMF